MLSSDPPEPGLLSLADGTAWGILPRPDGQLEPFGELDFIEVTEYFARCAFRLGERGASALYAEGYPSLAVCRAALLGARAAGLPIHIAMELSENGRAPHGSDPTAALVTLQALGAASFGFGPDSDASAAREALNALRECAAIPLLAFPPRRGAPPVEFAFVPEEAPREEGIVAACDSCVFALGDTCDFSEPVACALDMSDAILEVENNSHDVLLVRVGTPDDARSFSLNAHMARLPVAFSSDREDALEMALALYCGRALVDSLSELPRAALEHLARLYGAAVV